jgi:hypothetical protein
VEGSCEDGNEPSGSLKCWEVLTASQEGLSSIELIINAVRSCVGSWVEFPSLQVRTERVSVAVELLTHIRQGLGSNLDCSTSYLE